MHKISLSLSLSLLILHFWWYRFGYDYPYEREGGRPGYSDERPHGQYTGRSSGGYPSGSSGSYYAHFNHIHQEFIFYLNIVTSVSHDQILYYLILNTLHLSFRHLSWQLDRLRIYQVGFFPTISNKIFSVFPLPSKFSLYITVKNKWSRCLIITILSGSQSFWITIHSVTVVYTSSLLNLKLQEIMQTICIYS